MLRFMNPALVTPENFDLLGSIKPTPKARRNLTLITKVIQNISNRRLFNEDFMLCLNSFIEEQSDALEEYLLILAHDPLNRGDESNAFKDIETSGGAKLWNPHEVSISDYEEFHRLFLDQQDDILGLVMELPGGESIKLHHLIIL